MKKQIKLRNKNILILPVVIIILLFSINQYFTKNNTSRNILANNGDINLSNWNFNEDGNVKLDGSWEFYPNELLLPKDIDTRSSLEKHYIQVPGRWVSELSNGMISDKGVGTYRLKAKVNKDTYMYGLKIINIRSSCRIFVNGIDVGKIGNPKTNSEDGYITNVMPLVTFFPSKDETLDIVIQVANLEYYNGGIIQSIYLGSDKEISDSNLKSNILEISGLSFLFISGMYYLGIFIKSRKDKQFKYMGIICLGYSYIGATGNEKIFNKFFGYIPFFAIIKLRTIIVCLIIYFISLFVRELGENFISIKCMKIIKNIVLINIMLILIIQIKTFSFLEILISIINIFVYIFIIGLILKSVMNKQYGDINKKLAIFLICGICIVEFQYISWILYFFSISNNNILVNVASFILVIIISVIFIEKYIKAYSQLEVMSNNLIALDRTKDEFLVNTSHEFKTPLNAIINISQVVLSRDDENKEKIQKNLLDIISIATRLSNLVNDIIDFQSFQNGKLKFNKTIFDINGSIQVVVDILSYMRKNEEIELINSVPVGKYYVYADENRTKQIIYNIVGNSLKYTENGYVEIKAQIIDEYVYLSVQDTGIGIDKETQLNLFKRNIQTGKMNFNNSTSSGLGLSISKVLALNMGGDIYLKWSEPNRGSIFEMKIPKIHNDKDKKTIKQDSSMEEIQTTSIANRNEDLLESTSVSQNDFNIKKLKILIVDDEVSNVKALQEIFDEKYHETLIAYNGIQALEIIKNHEDISIVLLDVMMPGISGYEVCRKIRQEYKMFEIPILLLTVRNTPEDIEMGFEVGANDFLVKPFNFMELKARVKTLQNMRDAVKEVLKMETIFLQSQIKPHFLYNALSIIISLCYVDGEKAGKLLEELSKYLRFTFDINPYNSFITLKQELSFVKSYIELEKARFGKRLNIDLDIDEDSLEYRIPALIIQPIVENSIRHGLMKRITGGTVHIYTKKNKDFIKIMIKDDGIGIETEKLNDLLNVNGDINSGVKNVNKRLINVYGQGLLIDSEKEKGTTVTINIPTK